MMNRILPEPKLLLEAAIRERIQPLLLTWSLIRPLMEMNSISAVVAMAMEWL